MSGNDVDEVPFLVFSTRERNIPVTQTQRLTVGSGH